MSDQDPPPHVSDDTGSSITVWRRVVAGIAAGGVIVLNLFLFAPWIENSIEVSESTAVMLGYGILFVLVAAHMSGRFSEARSHRRRQDL